MVMNLATGEDASQEPNRKLAGKTSDFVKCAFGEDRRDDPVLRR
jgi:hypothetical protein